MDGFNATVDSNMHGAASIKDLSCYLFLAIRGDITFNQLKQFIPDSNDIVQIYKITEAPIEGSNIRSVVDTVHQQLQRGLIQTKSKASELKANWSDAQLQKTIVIEMDDQKIPSKRIIIESKAGETTLRASAKCMQLNGRWFIGEDIHFGQ